MRFNASRYNQHWQDKELNELGEFQRGKSRHRPRNDPRLFEEGIYPLVQTGEVKEANLYITTHSAVYNEFGLSQSKIWSKDTLCITIAANIAETSLLGYPMCFPDSVVGFNADPEESSELFMHYVFTYIRRAIQNSASGSIQDNINLEYLKGLNFKIPLKKYQYKISNVLSTLDMKIDCNERINAELVAIAKTIYDYWFVQFDFPDANGNPYKTSGGLMDFDPNLNREIPADWESLQLSDIISRNGTGLNPRDHFKLGEGENFYITIKNMENGKILLDDNCDRINDKAMEIIDRRSQLKPGDVLFTSIEPVGECYLIQEKPEDWNVNESVFTLRADYEKTTAEHLYLLLCSCEMKAYSKNVASGSVHKGIRHENLKAFKISYGNKIIIDKFTKIVKPILRRIYTLDEENKKLLQLRDWLLPMLMTGQVSVK